MYRFMLFLGDNRPSVGFHTEGQLNTYMQNAIPDLSEVVIYTNPVVAVRAGWKVPDLVTTSVRKPAFHFARWSRSDEQTLITLREQGWSHSLIARKLKRTPSAVMMRTYFLLTVKRKNKNKDKSSKGKKYTLKGTVTCS